MRRPKKGRPHRRRTLDGIRSERQIGAHISRRLEVQLAMVVAMIPDRVALVGNPAHDLGPSLGVTPENEKRRCERRVPRARRG